MSNYLIQVVHRETGKVVSWAPGLDVEKQLVSELVDRVRAKGVGILRTTEHVARDVHAALEELLYDLKSRV
jgi:hypothetical protein